MAEPQRLYFSYNQIHETIRATVVEKKLFEDFKPTLIISIGGGGFIPARILRTFLKQEHGKTIPIQAIGLTLYEHEDCCDPLDRPVRKTQWLTYSHVHGTHEAAVSLQGHTILIVDEVDDTRKTLAYAVEELQKDIQVEKAAWLAQQQQQQQRSQQGCVTPVSLPGTPSPVSPEVSPPGSPMAADEDNCQQQQQQQQQQVPATPCVAAAAAAAEWQEPRIGVFVVHNKLKPKKAQLPAALMDSSYFTGGDIDDLWVIYPWDAPDIWDHTEKAHSPGSATAAMVSSTPSGVPAAAAAQPTDAAATPMVC